MIKEGEKQRVRQRARECDRQTQTDRKTDTLTGRQIDKQELGPTKRLHTGRVAAVVAIIRDLVDYKS